MMMLLLIGTVLILWLWSRNNRHKDEPPVYSGSKILFGHALQFAGASEKLWNTLLRISTEALERGGVLKTTIGPRTLYELWNTLLRISTEALERGGVLKTTIGPRTLYVLSDPEDFLKASNACIHKDAVYDFTRAWVGNGLTTSKPPLWKIHRKLLNPAFSQHVLDSFMDVFNSQARCLVQNLKTQIGKGPFDHWEYIKPNAFETICLTALGVDLKEKNKENLEFLMASAEIFNILVSRFQKFWLHNNLLFNLSSLRRRQDKCIRILHSMSNKILKQKKEYLTKNLSSEHNEEESTKGTRFKPFMELLLELSRESDVFTDLVIREQVDTFIVAGLDTTANAVMFCMLMVGSYPQVQDKIYEELRNIFGGEDRDVTKKDLSQLVYLEAVIKESMRIYPTVPVIGRYLEEDIKLRNCTLYKGNSLFMVIHGVYRHSMWGPDVKEFRPERWLDASTLPDFPNPLVGFSLGRRSCIGKTYAMMSMKITLAHFFRSYIVHGDHSKVKLKLEVFLKPVSGHHISIETRNS